MIIELHLLQSFPASNLNRDDVGQPKSVTFGGVLRGRISSQCLKRSARSLFQKHGLDISETGVRTKRLLTETARKLDGTDTPEAATEDVVREALRELGFGIAKNDLTEYLMFVGHRAVDELAGFCRTNWDAFTDLAAKRHAAAQKSAADAKKIEAKLKKIKPDRERLEEARRILDARRVADIALFGRMVADNKDFNVNAASQVAHAFSTHAVNTEFDYYTAVDDLKPEAEAGADMIGTVDFNAACYYRYANLDLDQLTHNLDNDKDLVERAATAWLRSFIHATPSGKQNSTAARTMPETLLTVVRDHGAWNLANAFLRPVTGTDVLTTSTTRMREHFTQLRGFYGEDEIRQVTAATLSEPVPALAESDTVGSMTELTHRTLTSALG
ncbi:type I-E CRISPR-associated protein Cas7/Cse4/CasC [Saccharopolyspora phatthalungensis]|uniref:CRISPR system Cascade subunit CasC n=1 Tax=Saccharopolyspora phatthalungensis TaxID=664693 RepID=A0A840QC38_9PSEU|nr:type I-E CRISPR-associated protein Cas7/Cse4/CasC [Saccharopolyspora phatthalungensis]MBB5157381.1 CRISPR system Cascade subunit CasC [Saccharopolyspora phatthalungensis]